MKQQIVFLDYFSKLDWALLILSFSVTFMAIFWGNLQKKQLQTKPEKQFNWLDYILMGRQLSLPLFVCSLVASWYGGIFGVTEIAFQSGLYNFITQGLFWYISYFIFALFVVPKIKKTKAITLADLCGKMFGPKSEKVAAIFNLFNLTPISYSISIGLLLQIMFGGSLSLWIILGTSFVAIYSLLGGFRAVVYSDFVQFFIMFISVILVVIFSINSFGGLSFLISNLPKSHFSLTGGHSIGTTLAWGFIALSTLVDPNFYQRVFAAKNEKVAKSGIFLSIALWVVFDICTTSGAMYAKAVIPNADSSSAYLTYALQLLPNGLRGLFIAGIIATILSTLDSYILSASNILVIDLLPKKWRIFKSTHWLSLFFIAFLSVTLSHFFEGNIKLVWKTLGSFSAACLLFPIMLGYIFPKQISDIQFTYCCLVSAFFTALWKFSPKVSNLKNVDEIYIGILVSAIFLLLCIIRNKRKISEKNYIS